ncbi:MAG: hypothetical protein JNN20_00845 [Betaproteobacteria bacterium]|nr:hypothetical protein [Betaproteobacteria bacterium]
MFERLSRSWELVKASGSVLKQDKELLLFPLISSIATLLVIACFALPVIGMGALDGLSGGGNGAVSAGVYVLAFLFYLSQYFVIFFFNAALVGAAMIRLDGGNPTFSDGLRIATSKAGSILGYAAIAATVGMILRAIQERVGFLGKIIVGMLGAGWTVATYMVVPVLVARDIGPIDAVKESAMLLKKTWGENIAGQVGLGAAFTLIQLGVIGCGIALIIAMAFTQSSVLIILAVALVVIAVIITALIHAALSGIYSAALYRYASDGEGTAGFDNNALQLAFTPKS